MSAAVVGAVTAVVGAVTGIAGAISGNQRQKDAIRQQGQMAYLDLAQKKDLQEAMMKTDSANKRIEILTNAAATIRAAQTSAILGTTIASRQASKDADNRNLVIAVVGGGVVLVGALFVLKKS
jgi:hypothetical protein